MGKININLQSGQITIDNMSDKDFIAMANDVQKEKGILLANKVYINTKAIMYMQYVEEDENVKETNE